MKKIIALFASTILILLSCDDWSGVESLESGGSAADIAGQWYMEDMDNSMISMFAEYTFMPFGGDVYANEYWKVNGFKKSIPKVAYSVDNNSIAMYIGSGKYDIELRGNALTMKAEQITQDEVIRPLHMQFMRIVGTLSLDVDSVIRLDSLQQIIEAYTAKPTLVTAYTITDNRYLPRAVL